MCEKWKFDDTRPYVFVSYKREDREVVQEVIEAMYQNYSLNIWYDANLTLGRNWDAEALPYLRDPRCKAVILFASTKALTSKNVMFEMDNAKFYGKLVIPINFSPKPFARLVREDILEEYNLRDNEKVTVAQRMVQEYLDNKLTYLTWNDHDESEKAKFFAELWRALEHNAPDVCSTAVIPAGKKAEAVSAPASAPDVRGEEKAPEPEGRQPISYTLYGKQSTARNQSDLMYQFFQTVLEHHPEYIGLLTDQHIIQCTSGVNYTLAKNRTAAMPVYFRVCQYLTFSNGKGLCVGTSYGKGDKARKMAQLLALCSEDPTVFSSDEMTLPRVRPVGRRG